MLVLQRKKGETVMIDDEPMKVLAIASFSAIVLFREATQQITLNANHHLTDNCVVRLTHADNKRVAKFAFGAPSSVKIHRSEVYNRIHNQGEAA